MRVTVGDMVCVVVSLVCWKGDKFKFGMSLSTLFLRRPWQDSVERVGDSSCLPLHGLEHGSLLSSPAWSGNGSLQSSPAWSGNGSNPYGSLELC